MTNDLPMTEEMLMAEARISYEVTFELEVLPRHAEDAFDDTLSVEEYKAACEGPYVAGWAAGVMRGLELAHEMEG